MKDSERNRSLRRVLALSVLLQNERRSLATLALEFHVSERTIRRDIDVLADHFTVRKVNTEQGTTWSISQ